MSHARTALSASLVLIMAAGAAVARDIRPAPQMTQEALTGIRLTLIAPPGIGALTLVGFEGRESISSLYSFELDLATTSPQGIPIDAVLGKEIGVAVTLPNGTTRHFNGICSRFSAGDRDVVSHYSAEIVPKLWLLTRRQTSRIFQEMSVPEIVRQVLGEVPGMAFEMRLEGAYAKRNYVAQYRETDFDFISRLLEDEGIFYFFTHAPAGHTLILADSPGGHLDLPGVFPYTHGTLLEDRPGSVQSWDKSQEIRSGKSTLRDHSFELPSDNLEVSAAIQETVLAGGVTHRLAAGGGATLELYDFPGGYAKRFDGVDPGGGERPGELPKIVDDGRRTVGIRMQEEAASALVIHGASTAPVFTPGYRFQLTRHFDGDGAYILTAVQHAARALIGGTGVTYRNQFECIPAGLPFRPRRTTPKPVIEGTQTAVVVGPPGEETFTDRYGRVKVQFHWDREGQRDGDSSCWVRVGALHAGAESGSVVIPRVGWEVVVSFLEGDPDQPIILGSVYNPEHLPPADPNR